MKQMILNSCFIFLLTTCFSQKEVKLPSDFSTLQRVSIEELELKRQAHKEMWGLEKIERWDLSQDTGELVFSLPEGFKAVAPAQIIGSYNSKDSTWLWAWANTSVDEKLKTDALKVRKYGQEHQIDRLTKAKWLGTQEDAWAMVALAVKFVESKELIAGRLVPHPYLLRSVKCR